MKRYAPLLTLLAVAIVGVALVVVTMISDPNRTAANTGVAAPAAAATDSAAAAVPPTQAAAPSAAAVTPPVVAEKVYAGRSSGNEVTVAIAVKDGRAVAYVCDGAKIEAWLEGTLSGDQLSLKNADGATITGTASETDSFGNVAVGGKQWPYSAKGVTAPAGLYRGQARGVAVKIGWIKTPDGKVTGNANRNGVTEPAPPFDPANQTPVFVDGVPVDIAVINGSDDVTQ